MHVFLGLSEICNITNTYAQAFRSLGHETLTAIARRNKYYSDSDYNVVLFPRGQYDPTALVRWAGLFPRAVMACDLFIFTCYSFLPAYLDLALLKQLGKNIVFVFWGSEVRSIDAFEQQMRSMGVADEYLPFIEGVRTSGEKSAKSKLQRIRAAESYANLILSQPGYAQLQHRPYMRANVPLDLTRFTFSIPGRNAPLVVHAPSSPLTKGTSRIVEAVGQLRDEGIPFDFRFIENMPHAELCKLLTSADIVVDELYADAIGVLSAESMATGNAVLTHYPTEFTKVPGDCPAINITQETLVENLRRAILDKTWRCELAARGREYVEQYNDHVKIARDILKWVQPGGIEAYDFVPEFYKHITLPDR